ncbi:stress response protein YvgO-like [Bradysia coprophila]|uniref:stress response protein YvgO-like n=1 Tax=Bradysia coprophila TaxID=38358 RepID=UPI00187D8BDD|nr:stress response protein YvgO-like [Bradysia coprophila]
MATNFHNTGSATNAGDIGRDLINIHGVEAQNINFYLPPSNTDTFWQLVKKEILILTGNATGNLVSAAVKSLGEKIQLQLEKDNNRLHYVIFNLSQSYFKSLHGFVEYQEHYIYGILFGVWIFESGQFENTGIGSFENWCFGGYKGGNWTRSGEPIKFFRNPYWPWVYNYGEEGRLVTFSKIKFI